MYEKASIMAFNENDCKGEDISMPREEAKEFRKAW